VRWYLDITNQKTGEVETWMAPGGQAPARTKRTATSTAGAGVFPIGKTYTAMIAPRADGGPTEAYVMTWTLPDGTQDGLSGTTSGDGSGEKRVTRRSANASLSAATASRPRGAFHHHPSHEDVAWITASRAIPAVALLFGVTSIACQARQADPRPDLQRRPDGGDRLQECVVLKGIRSMSFIDTMGMFAAATAEGLHGLPFPEILDGPCRGRSP